MENEQDKDIQKDIQDERPETVEILYQDDQLVVVDKPSGILVHPFKKFCNDRRTLMKLVRNQLDQYVYPVHRLDRQVSGALIFGLNGEIVKEVKAHWHDEDTVKEYVSLVKGYFDGDGEFKFELRDDRYKKKALTQYWILHEFEDTTLVRIRIKTGRKHQIRRHFSRRMHHVLGDTRYGYRDMNEDYKEKYGLDRMFLHCRLLEINHPLTGERIVAHSPLPDNLKQILIEKGMTDVSYL